MHRGKWVFRFAQNDKSLLGDKLWFWFGIVLSHPFAMKLRKDGAPISC